jgi:hypothetical protein
VTALAALPIPAWVLATPVCPAGPERTIALVADRYGIALDASRQRVVLERRAGVIGCLRSAGDVRAGEVAGWLSLAALVCGGGARLAGAVLRDRDPVALLEYVRADTGDGAGELSDPDPDPAVVERGELTLHCATSPVALAVADLAGRAASGRLVLLGDRPVASGWLCTALRDRLTTGVAR